MFMRAAFLCDMWPQFGAVSSGVSPSGVSPSGVSLAGPLVEHEPIQAEALHGFGEAVELDGLLYVAVRTELVAPHHVFLLFGGRHDNHRQERGACVGPNSTQDF